jgi:hypothetical protein
VLILKYFLKIKRYNFNIFSDKKKTLKHPKITVDNQDFFLTTNA